MRWNLGIGKWYKYKKYENLEYEIGVNIKYRNWHQRIAMDLVFGRLRSIAMRRIIIFHQIYIPQGTLCDFLFIANEYLPLLVRLSRTLHLVHTRKEVWGLDLRC